MWIRYWDAESTATTLFSGLLVDVGSAATTPLASLRAETLSLSQMPSGWSARQPTYDVRMGCLTGLLEPRGVTQTHVVEVYYLARGSLPQLIETLSTYSNAQLAYQKIASIIAACRTVSGVLKGYAVTGTVRPMASVHYGNSSVVYALTLSGAHVTWRSDYAIVRKGNAIITVLEGSYPAVSDVQFSHFVATAVAKVK